MSSEKFCLRWNDFERNISSAFKDIRDEKEFFDITIACEDEQLQAHKVILSACSPFFKQVLRRNTQGVGGITNQLVLYLKGVKFRDMEAVLNFMYHGEVNVAQDDLNSFLQVAEDLRVKGLTQNNPGSKIEDGIKADTTSRPIPNDINRSRHIEPSSSDQLAPPAPKRPRPPQPTRPALTPAQQHDDDEIEEIVPVVKSEPRDATIVTETNVTQEHHQQEEEAEQQQMAMYGGEDDGGPIMQVEQYDDSYGEDYGYAGDQSYEGMAGITGDQGSGRCDLCGKTVHPRALKRHYQTVHSEDTSNNFSCSLCDSTFKTEMYLKDHLRRRHKLYQSKY